MAAGGRSRILEELEDVRKVVEEALEELRQAAEAVGRGDSCLEPDSPLREALGLLSFACRRLRRIAAELEAAAEEEERRAAEELLRRLRGG